MGFDNRSFEDVRDDGAPVGWTVVLEQVFSGRPFLIEGQTFMAPIDTTPPFADFGEDGGPDTSVADIYADRGITRAWDDPELRRGFGFGGDPSVSYYGGPGFDYYINTETYTEGSRSLQLFSEGNITPDSNVLDYGYGVVRGPYVYSTLFGAQAGQSLQFDWRASDGGDAFDVFGFLLNVNTGQAQIVLNETGGSFKSDGSGVWDSETQWESVDVQVGANGDYRFVFFHGTFDESGGSYLGANLFLDNFRGTAVTVGAPLGGDAPAAPEEETDGGGLDGPSAVGDVTPTLQADEGIEVQRSTEGAGVNVAYAGDPTRELQYQGGAANETVSGGSFRDSIRSGGGNDNVFGEGGDDLLEAGDGDDVVDGGTGDDVIIGGAGNDVLFGGDGQDRLTGGAGADMFAFAQSSSSLSSETSDAILDFAAEDRIILVSDAKNVSFGASSVSAASLDALFALGREQATAQTKGGQAGIFVFTSAALPGQSVVFYDSNGDGVLDGGISITGSAPVAGSFGLLAAS